MTKTIKNSVPAGIIFPLFFFLTTVQTISGQENSTALKNFSDYDIAISAAREMARGNFEPAREKIIQLKKSTPPFELTTKLESVLGEYDGLMKEILADRKKAYQQHIEAINELVHTAQQAEQLYEMIMDYDPNSAEKDQFADRLLDDIQVHWLDALRELSVSHYLAEKVHIQEVVSDEVREDIIRHGLEIADEFIEQDEGLEAYNKVYVYLSGLDKEKYQYDELLWRLKRQAMMSAMYVPDPNHNGIGWEERRDNISLEIVANAFAVTEAAYVTEANFQEMAVKGLQACLLMAETDKLNETFEKLGDRKTLDEYRNAIIALRDMVNSFEREKFYTIQLLGSLTKAMEINKKTLQFPDEVLIAEFTDGAYTALDSYTYVVWPTNVAEFRKEMTNEFSGIGVRIEKVKGKLKINSLLSYDTPAYRAGLDAGDTILAVDGQDTKPITLEKAVRLITGPRESKVVLTIDREGFGKPRDFTVIRGQIEVDSIEGYRRDVNGNWKHFLDPHNGIAYVRLRSFSGVDVPGALVKKLEKLKKQNMKSLILDLRNNSGGYLSHAVSIADAFIDAGSIVSSRYRNPDQEDVKKATSYGTYDNNLPLVVLINSLSASASEIVSGALKDNHRALLIGTRTFGKGSVQTIQSLQSNDAQMKMTVAYYYLPSGRRVHRDPKDKSNEDYGVMPDIELEMTGKQLEKLYRVQRDSEILHRDDLLPEARKWELYTAEDILQSDPQLRMAVLCLKAQYLVDATEIPQTIALESQTK